MNTKIVIFGILCCIMATDFTSAVAQTPNCEKTFYEQLNQIYNKRKKRFIKKVRHALISKKLKDSPDLRTMPSDSILVICKMYFIKDIHKLIEQGKIDKSKYLCYLNPKSMILDIAMINYNGHSYMVSLASWSTKKIFELSDDSHHTYRARLIPLARKYHPEIVFTSGFDGWDDTVFFYRDGKTHTVNLRTEIIEPVSENNTYIKNDLNISLGVLTKQGKIILCH